MYNILRHHKKKTQNSKLEDTAIESVQSGNTEEKILGEQKE